MGQLCSLVTGRAVDAGDGTWQRRDQELVISPDHLTVLSLDPEPGQRDVLARGGAADPRPVRARAEEASRPK